MKLKDKERFLAKAEAFREMSQSVVSACDARIKYLEFHDASVEKITEIKNFRYFWAAGLPVNSELFQKDAGNILMKAFKLVYNAGASGIECEYESYADNILLHLKLAVQMEELEKQWGGRSDSN